MHVEGGQGRALGDHREPAACQALRQPYERLGHFDDDATAACRDHRRVAQQHQAVAEALLGVKQNGLSRERRAAPERLGEIARLAVGKPPAPFELLERRGEFASQRELRERLRHMRVGVIGTHGNGAAELRQRLLESALVVQREAEIQKAFGQSRVELGRAAKTLHRFVEALAAGEHGTQIDVRGRGARVEFERTTAGGLRLVELSAQPQRATEVAVSLGVVRLEHDGAPVMHDRLVVAIERAEDDREVVVSLGVFGGKLDEAGEQVGGLLGIACLVAQHAEEVEGLTVVRRRGQDPPRDRLRFAAAIGLAQGDRLGKELARVDRRPARPA